MPGLPRFYSALLERHLTLVEGEVAIAGLPAAFDGLRVLLVTDIHTGPFLEPASLERVFRRMLAAAPDLVLLGGDLTTARADELPPCIAAFRALRAPLGVFAVLGNHDHYTREPDRVRGFLDSCGITVLHNRPVLLERPAGPGPGTARVRLAGIDDLHAGRPDLGAALDGAVEGQPVILLSHNPDVVFAAARRNVALVLSGHTHGGQVRIPGLPVLVRMSRYRLDEGHYVVDGGTQLVVSRGLGVTGLPIRVACPPEAVLITLGRADRR
jgi:predicted MPP superfamily phosphohydrolase